MKRFQKIAAKITLTGSRNFSSSTVRHAEGDILILNCGSSSIKCQIVDPVSEQMKFKTSLEKSELQDEHATLEQVLAQLVKKLGTIEFGAVGHRVVHGGPCFNGPTLINERILEKIESCTCFAPVHNPNSLTGIRTFQKLYPNTPQVAAFDTSFHSTIPELAHRYAIGKKYLDEEGIRKYGFHGHSHKFVTSKAIKMLNMKGAKIVSAHLGNGCSVCATDEGVSVDSSMGLTPLEELL